MLLAAFFALFMYSAHGPQSGESLAIFGFIPEELIHNTGIVVMIVVFAAGLVGVASMARWIARREGVGCGTRGQPGRARRSAPRCGQPSGASRSARTSSGRTVTRDVAAVPWYRRRGLVHAMAVWGFLGLLAATVLDYGLALIGVKETGTPCRIWYPVRLLGTVAGILLVYGVSVLIIDRYRAANRSVSARRPPTGCCSGCCG